MSALNRSILNRAQTLNYSEDLGFDYFYIKSPCNPLVEDNIAVFAVGRSVKLLLVFASTSIPGFSLLEIHDHNFYSLLDTYGFRNGASSYSTKEGSVFLCRP
jgi:hypothetical protein